MLSLTFSQLTDQVSLGVIVELSLEKSVIVRLQKRIRHFI